jgi:hypothetical protein
MDDPCKGKEQELASILSIYDWHAISELGLLDSSDEDDRR